MPPERKSNKGVIFASSQKICQVLSGQLTTKTSTKRFSLSFFQTLNLRGTDMLKTPCFKETMMGSIGITTILAVGYNFATSKSPKRILQIVFPISYFGN